MTFNLDEDALMNFVKKSDGFKQMQEDANERIRSVVREVNTSHSGRPVDEVDTEMRAKFADAGINPTEPRFTEVVEAVSRGEMKN